jgi:hypothetical protein
MSGVGDSRRRGVRKSERERERPAVREERSRAVPAVRRWIVVGVSEEDILGGVWVRLVWVVGWVCGVVLVRVECEVGMEVGLSVAGKLSLCVRIAR